MEADTVGPGGLRFITCPACLGRATRVKIGATGICCDNCSRPTQVKGIGGVKFMVGNKHYPKMTAIMHQNIVTRRIRDDGRSLPDARFRDSTERR